MHALVHAVNSFPANTPWRWHLESQLLSFVDNGESAMLEVGLTFEGFTDVIHLVQIEAGGTTLTVDTVFTTGKQLSQQEQECVDQSHLSLVFPFLAGVSPRNLIHSLAAVAAGYRKGLVCANGHRKWSFHIVEAPFLAF